MQRPLYHYTCASSLVKILEDGLIKQATLYVHKSERPAVWLSYAPEWEETASMSVQDQETGKEVHLKGLSALAEYETPCRLQVNPDGLNLVSWDVFKRTSGIRPAYAASLYDVALESGAAPRDWRASFEPIPVRDWIAVEIWQDDAWRSYQEVIDGARGLLLAEEGWRFYNVAKQ